MNHHRCIEKFYNLLLMHLGERTHLGESSLREKCPNTEFFLVRIFPYSD